jgi:hypothetical protein
VSEPSAFEIEMAIKKLKVQITRHSSHPCRIDKMRGRTIRSDSHKLINSVFNKEELPEEWKESIIVPIFKKGEKQIVISIEAC